MRSLLILCLLLASCGEKHDDYYETPNGFKVYGIQDQGSITNGLITVDEILEIVDDRINDFIIKHGVWPNSKLKFYVWDGWAFPVNGGWATGAFSLREARIDVALYTETSGPNPITNKPWSIIYDGTYHWADVAACPAMVFELERSIGMHQGVP